MPVGKKLKIMLKKSLQREQITSAAQMLGYHGKGGKVQEFEEQPFLDCKSDEKEEKEGRAKKKKKASKQEDQNLVDEEEGRKKKARRHPRKRSLSKGRCELSEEREEKEKKVKF